MNETLANGMTNEEWVECLNLLKDEAQEQISKPHKSTRRKKIINFDESTMTKEECISKLTNIRETTEEKLSKAEENLTDLETKEPDGDGVKYDRWLEKYEDAQILVDYYQEILDEIEETISSIDNNDKV